MNSGILKDILPPLLIRKIRGIRYGWHGDYKTWKQASSLCTGYDSDVILEKVKQASLKVKNGEAAFERDSVIFHNNEFSFPVISTLLSIALRNEGKLNVLDFGGSLGSTYFQNKPLLDNIPELNWCIIEQPAFVETGKREFEDERLKFFNNIDECLDAYSVDVILFSSVLQYLEEPFQFIHKAFEHKVRYLLIDRTPFVRGRDRITVQKVRPSIYKASYPCRFFNKGAFYERIDSMYEMKYEFDALDRANIISEFKGIFFEIRRS